MIQFNLLPDVKLAYIKARRQKRTLVSGAIGVSVASLALVLLMFSTVQFAQKKHINDLTDDIKSEVSAIQSIEDLDKILTIQNQLATLPDLHKSKPLMSRLFTYIGQTTPSNVKINKFDVDVAASTVIVTGTADSIATINTYADTLKFATFDAEPAEGEEGDSIKDGKPFTNISSTLSRDQETASFTIMMSFDPLIFDGRKKVTLIVPNIITTRSETEKPSALFEVPAENTEDE